MEKKKEEIREDLLIRLANKTGINTTEEGSIAVSIIDTLLDELTNIYNEMEIMRNQAYLSTSSGLYTDFIGELVDTKREIYETDSNYKARIEKSVYRIAGGNKIAIEEAALSVSGVASIDYRPFGAGTGSFTMYVYPEAGYSQLEILDSVKQALSSVVSEGIYYEVKQPTEIPVGLTLAVQFKETASIMSRQAIRNEIKGKIMKYLNNLEKDEVFIINEVVQLAMETSSSVVDLQILELKINNLQKVPTNTFPAYDERFISGEITIE